MIKKSIGIGDCVCVEWEHLPDLYGEVIYKPCNVGDSWVIKKKYGKIVHIILFARITQQEPTHE